MARPRYRRLRKRPRTVGLFTTVVAITILFVIFDHGSVVVHTLRIPVSIPLESLPSGIGDISCDIEIRPSQLTVDSVSQQYPLTWSRRLFSSSPRREYALYPNTTLTIPREPCHTCDDIDTDIIDDIQPLVVLTGTSNSGKSTLLQLMAHRQTPTNGRIQITTVPMPQNDMEIDSISQVQAYPVYVDQPVPIYNRGTVRQVLYDDTLDKYSWTDNKNGPCPPMSLQVSSSRKETDTTTKVFFDWWEKELTTLQPYFVTALVDALLHKVTTILDDVVLSQDVSTLDVSQSYTLALLEYCLASMLSMTAESSSSSSSSSSSDHRHVMVVQESPITANSFQVHWIVASPIVLMDEWLDKESTSVIQRFQRECLQPLRTLMGVLVVLSTHKLTRLAPPYRHVTLQNGKLVHDSYQK